MKTTVLHIMLAFVLMTTTAVMGRVVFRDKLIASGPQQDDRFGESVAIDGDVCVIGAASDEVNGFQAGSAYIFRYKDPNWVEEARLFSLDGADWDSFGWSVSISNYFCTVGAPGEDDNGPSSGAVYIFRYKDPNWVQEARLVPADGAENDWFGASVSVDGDVCAIGSNGDDDNENASGSVYIFRYDEPNWVQEAKLTASDPQPFADFGLSVSLNDGVCIVGAPRDDGNGNDSGAAYLFRYNGSEWVQEAKLIPWDEAVDTYFGSSVSNYGKVWIVGAEAAPHSSEWAGAYIFRYVDPNWVEEAKLTHDRGDVDSFGHAVSIGADICVVGAPWDWDYVNEFPTGSAYVFRFNGTEWFQERKLTAFDPTIFDEFGISVCVDADNLMVGAPGRDDGAGAAYTYWLCPTGDLSGDCFVGLEDVVEFAGQWLTGWNLPQ